MKKFIAGIMSIAMVACANPISAFAERKIDFGGPNGETVHIYTDELISGEIAFSKGMYTISKDTCGYFSHEENGMYEVLQVTATDKDTNGHTLDITLTPTGKFHENTELAVFGNYVVRPATCDQSQFRGDINCDGKKNIADLVCLNRHLMGRLGFRGMHMCRADVNGDNMVNIFDMVSMRKIVANGGAV